MKSLKRWSWKKPKKIKDKLKDIPIGKKKVMEINYKLVKNELQMNYNWITS